MPDAHIERYFDEACLVPALKAIGQSKQVAARTNLFPHHEDYFEIHLVMDGTLHWWVEDETHRLQPGSVYITKPKELHGAIKNTVQPCTLTWLQVDANVLADKSIRKDLEDLQVRTWFGANELMHHVNAILIEIREPQVDSQRIIEAYLQLFLAKLLRQYKNRMSRPNYPEHFKMLVDFIDAQLANEELVSIQDLSHHVKLSRSRIFQLFDEYAGQSPISYMNSKRIEQAKQKLKQSDIPITQLAMEMGYSSSQHFATMFKRMTGMTPREFRKLDELIPRLEEKELGKYYQKGTWQS